MASIITEAVTTIANALAEAYSRIISYLRDVVGWLGDKIRDAFGALGDWFRKAFEALGGYIYRLGEWIYNALKWVAEQLKNMVEALINWLINAFNTVASAVMGWWDSLKRTISGWLLSLVQHARRKMRESIRATITITMSWKAIERFYNEPSLRKLPGLLLALPGSVILGELLANIIDSLLPMPSVVPVDLMPSISMPTLTVTPYQVAKPPDYIVREAPTVVAPSVVEIGLPSYKLYATPFIYVETAPPAISVSLPSSKLTATPSITTETPAQGDIVVEQVM